MQVRNKIGVKSLNLTPTPTPPESEPSFGVQCRALIKSVTKDVGPGPKILDPTGSSVESSDFCQTVQNGTSVN